MVEASQDCIPIFLLTADRPPELHDTGANQTINQVNHFGSFVRYFSNLPPPDDKVPARMVLTTIDTAVFRATQEPFGPVHINCAFREPLAGVSCQWNLGSLKGLNMWMSNREPFTKHIRVTQFQFSKDLMNTYGQYKEVVEFDGYYLESEPCVACSCPKVPYTRMKLDNLKSETKFTDNRIIVKYWG